MYCKIYRYIGVTSKLPIILLSIYSPPSEYFEDNKIIVSFDDRSLFTNIPADFAINLILENIFTNGVKDFNRISKLHLKKLLHWTTEGTVFQF